MLKRFYPQLAGIPIKDYWHHETHAGAGVLCSKFDECAVMVIDAIGEFDTATIWHWREGKLKKEHSIKFPSSLGLFYSAVTHHVGLKPMEDEYILMGMAAYGKEENWKPLSKEMGKQFFKYKHPWISHRQTVNMKQNLQRGLPKNSFVGVSGSNESMFTSFKMKKIWKVCYNLNNFFFFKKNFNKFPNPHIRLPAFLLKQCDYLRFVKNRHYDSKKSAWITESGKNSMTAYFKEIGFNIYIVNSDKKKFSLNDMKESETYSYKNQDKVLISDRHIRNYLNFDISKKKLVEKRNWG